MDLEMNMSAPQEQFNDNQTQENEVVENTRSAESVDYSSFTIVELLAEFERLIEAEDKTEMHKNAEIIKSCFYKLLKKDQPEHPEDPDHPESASETSEVSETAEETTFKKLYARYKVLRADLMRNIEQQKEKNLEEKN